MDKLGVVDDENVKEDADGHDRRSCVHQVGPQPERGNLARKEISEGTYMSVS